MHAYMYARKVLASIQALGWVFPELEYIAVRYDNKDDAHFQVTTYHCDMFGVTILPNML